MLSKADYLNALGKLKGRDRIGVTGEIVASSIAGAGGLAAASTVASAVGATTFLGSSAFGSIVGGVFVTATPIGWVIGCAVAAGAIGYGTTKLVRSGQKGDSTREKHRNEILKKIKDKESMQTKPHDELVKLMHLAVNNNAMSNQTSLQILSLVEDGSMDIEVAIDRIARLLNASG